MDETLRSRQKLLARLLHIAGGGSIGLSLLSTTHCGGKVFIDVPGSATSGSGGAGGASTSTSTSTSTNGQGGFFSVGGAGPTGSSSTGQTSFVTEVCVPASADGTCPDKDSAAPLITQYLPCEYTLQSVVSGPVQDGSLCCYDVEVLEFPCYVGRTFFIDEGSVKAEIRRGKTWRAGPAPDASGLPAATRRALADAWARDGLFEHASVASFARFTMQLLALGAPADLVRDAQAAAIDEVKHAEISLMLASAYEGEAVEPAGLPFPAPLAITPDLPAIAMETVMEGCIGETVATVQALEALERATDPAVRDVLLQTAEDEARHAELAWRFMAWAIDVGGPATRDAIVRAFAGFHPPAPSPERLEGVDLELFAAHGRQTAAEARAIAERTLREIVGPAACALLSRGSLGREAARPAPYAERAPVFAS